MSQKTIISVIVCAALWAVAGVSMRQGERGITRIDFSGVDIDSIDAIEITGAKTATLKKTDDTWTIAGKRADAGAIKRLADAIPKISSTSIITSNADRYADLETDDEKGVHIKALSKGSVVADFIVGKSSSGGSHIRTGDDVYSVSGVFPGTFKRDTASWRDKKLFDSKITDVTAVNVSLQGKPAYTLVKDGNDWKPKDPSLLPEGFRFDSSAAKRMVTSLINLRVRDFVDEDPGAEKTGLNEGYDVLSFTTKDGTKTIQLGKTENKTIYTRQKESGELATLNEYTVKGLRKQLTDLRDLGVMNIDDKNITKLEITKGAQRVVFEKQGEGAEAKWVISSANPPAPTGFDFDPMIVGQRLSSLKRTKALAVITDKTTIGVTSGSIIATDKDGKQAALKFGSSLKHDNRDALYAQGNADKAVYVLGKSTVDSLLGQVESFKRRAAPPPGMGGMGGMGNIDAKTLQGLPPEIRKQLEQQMQKQKQQEAMMKRIQAQQQ